MLYRDFRDGRPEALAAVMRRLTPRAARWANQWPGISGDDVVTVPMPGSNGMNLTVASQLPYPAVPALVRDDANFRGSEYKTAMTKLRGLSAALAFDLDYAVALHGKHVMLIDDAITDGISYLAGANLLYRFGQARKVGLVALGETIRHPRQFANPLSAVAH